MPIFDNEINDKGVELSNLELPNVDLRSPTPTQIDSNLGMGDPFGLSQTNQHAGLSWEDIGKINVAEQTGFDRPFSSVTKGALMENKRYPMYQRDVDLENIYGLQQSGWSQLANGVLKAGVNLAGTFAQGFADIPNLMSAIKTGDVSKLSGDPNGYEGNIDKWMTNMEDILPNYYAQYEREHPFRAMIPFTQGSANWWGDKFAKNLGFMGGAILNAVVTDAALAVGGAALGEVPLIANLGAQVGKMSLWLNKLATGTNDLTKVLDVAKGLGKTGAQLSRIEKIGQFAALERVTTAARYATIVAGQTMTEAGTESRNGYREVKEDLTRQYKLDNGGREPIGEDAEKIENYATSAMNYRFGANMAILGISNMLQLDGFYKAITKTGFSEGVSSTLTKTIEGAGKIGLKKGSLDVFEKQGATSLAGKAWESIRPAASSFLTEGVYEEGGQFAAEKGTYDYFTRKYKANPKNWKAVNEAVNSANFGFKEQFGTTEGLESMLIGGLTGLLIGKAGSVYDNYKGVGKDARLASALNVANLNGITSTLANNYGSAVTSVGIANDMQEAARTKDVFKYKNLQSDAFFDMVHSGVANDMHDLTIEKLNMLRGLSKEEFESKFQMDFNASNKKTVDSYIDALVEKANSIKGTADAINNTFKNPFKNAPKAEDIDSIINLIIIMYLRIGKKIYLIMQQLDLM